MEHNEETQSNNGSTNQPSQPLITIETILSDLPCKPIQSEYHKESVDPIIVTRKGAKLEE